MREQKPYVLQDRVNDTKTWNHRYSRLFNQITNQQPGASFDYTGAINELKTLEKELDTMLRPREAMLEFLRFLNSNYSDERDIRTEIEIALTEFQAARKDCIFSFIMMVEKLEKMADGKVLSYNFRQYRTDLAEVERLEDRANEIGGKLDALLDEWDDYPYTPDFSQRSGQVSENGVTEIDNFVKNVSPSPVSQSAPQRRCPHCGNLLSPNSPRCLFCGKVLSKPETTRADQPKINKEETDSQPNDKAISQSRTNKKKIKWINIIGLCIIAVLLAGNIYQHSIIKGSQPQTETEDEQITAWLAIHGDEYKEYSDFYANMNCITVHVGEESMLTVSQSKPFDLLAEGYNTRVCSVKIRSDLQTVSGQGRINRIEVVGIREGITAIEITKKGSDESFSVLVHVIP